MSSPKKLINKLYPLAQSTFSKEEARVAKRVIDSNFLTMGTNVKEFELAFAQWTGAKHALMVNSGSSANLIMVEALLRRSKMKPPLKSGDEVLVPALSWPTTVWPLLQLGLVPIYVDVTLDTLSMDLKSAKSKLSSKTKAMFLIHVLGQTSAMEDVLNFCRTNNLILIEDTCESLGAHFNGVHAGNFGLLGSFSCYFSHHISTIEGGIVVTSDDDLYDDLKSIRSHGWLRDRSDQEKWLREYPEIDPRFMFIMPGYNVRPTEIQGALGLVQLKKLDRMLDGREKLAYEVQTLTQTYTPWMRLVGSEHFATKGLRNPQRRSRRHSWMTLPFLLSENSPVDIKTIKRIFEDSGVETRPIIAGNLARHPASKHLGTNISVAFKNADFIFQNGFMIGCHPVDWRNGLAVLAKAFRKASSFTRKS